MFKCKPESRHLSLPAEFTVGHENCDAVIDYRADDCCSSFNLPIRLFLNIPAIPLVRASSGIRGVSACVSVSTISRTAVSIAIVPGITVSVIGTAIAVPVPHAVVLIVAVISLVVVLISVHGTVIGLRYGIRLIPAAEEGQNRCRNSFTSGCFAGCRGVSVSGIVLIKRISDFSEVIA